MTSLSSAILLTVDSPVLALLLKVTLVLTLGLLVARFARRAATSHLILMITLTGAMAIPIVQMAAPHRVVELPGIAAAADAAIDVPATRPTRAAQLDAALDSDGPAADDASATQFASAGGASVWPSLVPMLLVGWLAGAVVIMTTLAIDLRRVRFVRRQALPDLALAGRLRHLAGIVELRANVEIVVTEEVSGPLVTGLTRPTILLPADAATWPDDGLLRAVAHEMEHVRRADWPLQVLARTICAVYWFHPLVWMTWSRLCLAAERACDDAVTRVADPASYAEQLVTLARRRQRGLVGATLGMAGRTNLSARVRALLDPDVRRGPTGWPATVATAAVAASLVAFVAPLRAARATVAPPASLEAQDREAEAVTPLDRELYEAAARGRSDVAGHLITRGARVNAVIPGDGSPLIGAVRSGRIDIVRLLLDRGADPAMPVRFDGNPLIAAARGGHLTLVQALVDAGAPVNDIVPDDETALMGASQEGHIDVVRYLVERGADVNLRAWAGQGPDRSGGEWRTPLLMAERGRHPQVAAYLRSVGARE